MYMYVVFVASNNISGSLIRTNMDLPLCTCVTPPQDDDHGDLNNRVSMIMSHPIIYANMSTKPITVTRAMTGWWFFKAPRSVSRGFPPILVTFDPSYRLM